jgi:hypothetical protein
MPITRVKTQESYQLLKEEQYTIIDPDAEAPKNERAVIMRLLSWTEQQNGTMRDRHDVIVEWAESGVPLFQRSFDSAAEAQAIYREFDKRLSHISRLLADEEHEAAAESSRQLIDQWRHQTHPLIESPQPIQIAQAAQAPQMLSNKVMTEMIPMFVDSEDPPDHKCGSCSMRVLEPNNPTSDRAYCTIVEGHISLSRGTCAWWAKGPAATQDQVKPQRMSYDLAGYVEVDKPEHAVNCSTCRFYHRRDDHMGDCQLWTSRVKAGQCCMVWDGQAVVPDKPKGGEARAMKASLKKLALHPDQVVGQAIQFATLDELEWFSDTLDLLDPEVDIYDPEYKQRYERVIDKPSKMILFKSPEDAMNAFNEVREHYIRFEEEAGEMNASLHTTSARTARDAVYEILVRQKGSVEDVYDVLEGQFTDAEIEAALEAVDELLREKEIEKQIDQLRGK